MLQQQSRREQLCASVQCFSSGLLLLPRLLLQQLPLPLYIVEIYALQIDPLLDCFLQHLQGATAFCALR